jgi:hypothetical protein
MKKFYKNIKIDNQSELYLNDRGVVFDYQWIIVSDLGTIHTNSFLEEYISNPNFYESIQWTNEEKITSIYKSHGPFIGTIFTKKDYVELSIGEFWNDFYDSIEEHKRIVNIDFPEQYIIKSKENITKLIKDSSIIYLLNKKYLKKQEGVWYWRYDYWREYLICNKDKCFKVIMSGD